MSISDAAIRITPGASRRALGRITPGASRRALGALLGLSLAACAAPAAQQASSVPEPAKPGAAAKSDLFGAWAEYWSVQGAADTQRYVFLEDGRFAWLAPARTAPSAPIQKTGTFELEHSGAGDVLVLRVAAESFAPCSERCSHHDEGPRHVAHASPLTERYEIGECAPNQEAQAVDTEYACRAIGGRAFWRSRAGEIDAQSLFE